MRVFIWKAVENLTASYHSGGGLVVFAIDETRARQLFEEKSAVGAVLPASQLPDENRASSGPEAILFFPDDGCC